MSSGIKRHIRPERNHSLPKIEVIIDTNFHARSFFSTDLSERLHANFDVLFCISRDVDDRFIPGDLKVSRYRVPWRAKKLFSLVLDASLVRNVRKSSSFSFRLKRYLFGDYSRFGLISPSGVIRLVRSLLTALPGPYEVLKRKYGVAVKSIEELGPETRKFKPDMIITWSFSVEPTTLFGIVIARELQAKSMAVFDNWDNLSSKAVLIELPDYLVCFGKQSKDFAMKIHGMNGENCFALGSARFDSLAQTPKQQIQAVKKVLIAGSSIALEDKVIMDEIVSCIDSPMLVGLKQKISFSYRPHPQPQGASLDLDNWDYNNLISIEPSALHFRGESWQDQKELAHQLAQFQLVIAAPTTLMIEALLLGKTVIVPAFNVKGIKTSIKKMISNLEHLKIISHLKNVHIVETSEEMSRVLVSSLLEEESKGEMTPLDWVVTTSPHSFAERLSILLVNLLNSIENT